MVYFNNINGDEAIFINKNTVDSKPKTTQKATVVPVGQNKKYESEDLDKLPQGYYIEKSEEYTTPSSEPTDTPDETQDVPETNTIKTEETLSSESAEISSQDDELPDTKIHTDERIELSESITIASDEIKPIQDALDNAVRRGQMTVYNKVNSENNDVDFITKAETMMKHDTFQPLEMKYKKGLHASGLARFEVNDLNYDVSETAANIRWKSNAERIDLTGTYESKSGNTKLFGYLKGLTSQNDIIYKSAKTQGNDSSTEDGNPTQSTSDDVAPVSDDINVKSNYNEFCAYMGIKQKFDNGQALTAAGFHDIDKSRLTHTTEIDALYDLGFADVTGSAAIYKIGNTKATVKTNLSCKLKTFENPADEQTTTEQTQEEQTVQSSEEEQTQQTQQTAKSNGKKWDKKGGLILEFESEDDPEQGIGYYLDYRKNSKNSKTKFVVFGKASTTQRGEDEASSYHLTTGANLQYREKISPKYLFDLNLDVKDKVTVGGEDKGNITTAFGTARLTSKKLIAELEGKLILAKDTYKALALRLAYKFNPKLEVSAEGALVNQNENGVKLKGYTALGSVHISL